MELRLQRSSNTREKEAPVVWRSGNRQAAPVTLDGKRSLLWWLVDRQSVKRRWSPSESREKRSGEMWRAAIHETILNFPEKYSTIVGERGLKLSGGEKQRVSLARAFLKAPPILLCDEATSALDSTTEAEILSALKNLSSNRTSIFIAHRLTTAMQCDEIIVLENGKVAEQGPHDVLLSRAGRYAQLWAQQNNNEASDAAVKVEA